MNEQEFWQATFVAAIAAGHMPGTAASIAYESVKLRAGFMD